VEPLTRMVVPFMLVLGRVSGLVAAMPVFGWPSLPLRVRAGLALVLAIVFASVLPVDPTLGDAPWPTVALILVREVLTGAALGVAASVLYATVRQAGMIVTRQMGLAVAQEIDPVNGEPSQPVGHLLETCFTVFFLWAGGHRLLLRLMARSWDAWPIGQWPDMAASAEAILQASLAMLTFSLKLAAPMVAAFLVLAVVLAILARILPEMNILMASLPLRIGLGLFMAAALLPSLDGFTTELGRWIDRVLIP